MDRPWIMAHVTFRIALTTRWTKLSVYYLSIDGVTTNIVVYCGHLRLYSTSRHTAPFSVQS